MINVIDWAMSKKQKENEPPKLLKDVRCQDGITYFLYEIDGIENWYSLNQLKEMRIELPSIFKTEKQRLEDSKKIGQRLIFKNYDEYENEDVKLDNYSLIMNSRRVARLNDKKLI